MRLYIAHSISGEGDRGALRDRDDGDVIAFLKQLQRASISICDPAETFIPESDYLARFNYCLDQIRRSDVLLADASHRLGLGVGAEMMFAKLHDVLIFTICPDESYYRKSSELANNEWIHPFIFGLSSKIFRSFDECANELCSLRR